MLLKIKLKLLTNIHPMPNHNNFDSTCRKITTCETSQGLNRSSCTNPIRVEQDDIAASPSRAGHCSTNFSGRRRSSITARPPISATYSLFSLLLYLLSYIYLSIDNS